VRRWLARIALVSLAAAQARAHEARPQETALVQLGPDRTELLYELTIPASPDAVRRRVQADADHSGALTPDEYGRLAGAIAGEVARAFRLRLEGHLLPWRVRDAKVTNGGDGDGHGGRLQALVWLEARDVPPGLRKVEVEPAPLLRGRGPVRVAFETRGGPIKSLVGGRPAGADAVLLVRGEACTVLVEGRKGPPAPSK
jgi:hypothetical protein